VVGCKDFVDGNTADRAVRDRSVDFVGREKGYESRKKRMGDEERRESEASELENLKGGNQDGLRE